MKSTFQNPHSRRKENQRGPDGRYTVATFNQSEITADAEQLIRESTPILEESMLKTAMQRPTEISPVFGRGKRKLNKDRGQINFQLYLEKLNASEDTQHNITPTTEEHPNITTVTDKNGNTASIEQIENTNRNTNNELTTRKSSRIKNVIPIIRYGNPMTQ